MGICGGRQTAALKLCSSITDRRLKLEDLPFLHQRTIARLDMYTVVVKQGCRPGGHVRYYLAILLPNDAVLELQRSARECKVSSKELILDMIEDYLEAGRKIPRSATSAKKPPQPGS